jgi:hypothetical protein
VAGVLGLIRRELEENDARVKERRSTPWDVVPPFLRSDVWHALAAGGELRGMTPALLEVVARAYTHVEATSLVERELFVTERDPLAITTDWASVHQATGAASPQGSLRSVLISTDGLTTQRIQEALTEIDRVLSSAG